MYLNNLITIGIFVSLFLAWCSPVRKQYQVFQKIHLSFIAVLTTFIILVILQIANAGIIYDQLPGYQWVTGVSDPGFLEPVALLAIVISSLVFYRASKKLKDPPMRNRAVTPRKSLKVWYLLYSLLLVFGIGAWLIDLNHPSEVDLYTGTNDSANIILIVTLITSFVFGIGVRFSYLKYFRANQADLIASAISSHIQSPSIGGEETTEVDLRDTEMRLHKLNSLLSSGLVTEDEYVQKKKEIIDSL